MDDRTKYLGGTDCAAVLGLSRWKTPLIVWGEKTGMIEPEDISKKIAVRMGTKLEDAVCDLFSEETGKKVHKVNETIFHKKYPFLGANIDRKVTREDADLEAKTASEFKSDEWDGDEIPAEYLLQCHHYLGVTGRRKMYIACLIGNSKFVWKEILRDEKLIAEIISKEVHFWKTFVEPKVMPEIVTSKDGDTLYKLFPNAVKGQEVSLPDSVNQIIESLQSLGQDKKAVEGQIKKLENELKAKIKDNEIGNTGLYKIKWLNMHIDAYKCPEKNYRRIYYSKIKQEVQ